jgi:small nuclear ribonucleoprotein (snRNP)-like protein
VTVELKNDLAISGTLHSVDQYLNIKLNNTRVVNEQKYPYMVRVLAQALQAWRLTTPVSLLQRSVKSCFIRGSVVRYVVVSMRAAKC